MSRLPLYRKCIAEMTLLKGMCLSHDSTLVEAVSRVNCQTDLTHIALKNECDGITGILSITELFAGIGRYGDNAKLKTLPFESSAVISTYEPLAMARDLMVRGKFPVLAVIHQGQYAGMLSAHEVLKHWSRENDAEGETESPDPRANISNIVSQYVNYVAHDLRNPLCVIVAVGSLLQRLIHENEQLRQFSDLISRASQQALYLSDGLVQLERYAVAGRVYLQKVNLAELLETIWQENSQLVQYRGRTLVIEQNESLDVELDPYVVRRVLLNLIDNACKHSPVGSQVYLESKTGCVDGVKVIELSVRDEGKGMTQKESEEIFEPFFQLKNDKQALGYGLGLTIARRFSELHSGSIRAEVLRGIGTKFVLKIPYIES